MASISLIIPTYNVEEYIEECLASIYLQGFDDFEVIVIDDGSQDRTPDIIHGLAKNHPEIIFLPQKENRGQACARNIGLKRAGKEYVYFLDSDDKLADGKLKDMVDLAESKELDAVFFDGQNYTNHPALINQRDRYGRDLKNQFNRFKSYGYYESGQDLLINLVKDGEFIYSPCLYLVKNSLYQDYQAHFKEGIINEDNLFTIAVYLIAGKCCHVNEIVFLRRLRPDSTMTSKNPEQKLKNYESYYQNFLSLASFPEKFPIESKSSEKAFQALLNYEYKNFIAFSKEVDDPFFPEKLAKMQTVLQDLS